MTEEEAKTKWCPFSRVVETGPTGNHTLVRNRVTRVASDGSAVSSLAHGLAGAQCLGSDCMAWRWGQKPNPSYTPQHGAMWPQPHPPVAMYIRDETTGGCGLAGKP